MARAWLEKHGMRSVPVYACVRLMKGRWTIGQGYTSSIRSPYCTHRIPPYCTLVPMFYFSAQTADKPIFVRHVMLMRDADGDARLSSCVDLGRDTTTGEVGVRSTEVHTLASTVVVIGHACAAHAEMFTSLRCAAGAVFIYLCHTRRCLHSVWCGRFRSGLRIVY